MATQKGHVHPLPMHVWEITVQVDNGDWRYRRTSVPMPFDIAVRTAPLSSRKPSQTGAAGSSRSPTSTLPRLSATPPQQQLRGLVASKGDPS
jgi:hypothetical protein